MTKRIVVGIDGSENSRVALRWGFSLATRVGVELSVVSAWEYPAQLALPVASSTVSRDLMGAQAEADATAFVAGALGDEVRSVDIDVVMGSAVPTLLDRASSSSDLLVVGSRGRGGIRGLLLGSVSRECVEHAPCPVVVVRAEPADAASGPIVVGVDSSTHSAHALDWALELDDRISVGVLGVYAWKPPFAELRPGQLDDLRRGAHADIRQWMEERWPTADLEVHDGDPRRVLSTVVADRHAPLLALGRRGAGDLAPLRMGSVASHLVAYAPNAVAVVPDRP